MRVNIFLPLSQILGRKHRLSLLSKSGNLLQYSCLENSVDRGAWRATVPGVVELDMTEQVSAFTHPHPHTHTHTVVVFLFSLFVELLSRWRHFTLIFLFLSEWVLNFRKYFFFLIPHGFYFFSLFKFFFTPPSCTSLSPYSKYFLYIGWYDHYFSS